MSESRVTLATIDAAAIDELRASPPTTGVCEKPAARNTTLPVHQNMTRGDLQYLDRSSCRLSEPCSRASMPAG
jgi:hypothetical protein